MTRCGAASVTSYPVYDPFDWRTAFTCEVALGLRLAVLATRKLTDGQTDCPAQMVMQASKSAAGRYESTKVLMSTWLANGNRRKACRVRDRARQPESTIYGPGAMRLH